MLCGAICALVSTSVAQIRLGLQTSLNMTKFSKLVHSNSSVGLGAGALVELGGERSPWVLRLEANWENSRLELKDYNLESSSSGLLSYDLSLGHLITPLSLGYRLYLPFTLGTLSLTPRVGVFRRQGLSAKGRITSFMLNTTESDTPSMLEIDPYVGASGESSITSKNPTGVYKFEAYNKVHYGMFVALDLGVGKHWQVSASYRLGAGSPIQKTSTGKGIYLNNVDFGLSYRF